MNKRDVLETWYRRVWLEEDMGAIDEMMTEDAPVHGLNTAPSLGAAEFKAFAQALLKLIAKTTITIDDYMEDGDKVSVLMNIRAACRKTGKPVQVHGLAMGRIVNGQIVSAHNYVDFIGLFEQLGVMPQNAMQSCLCGQELQHA